MRVPLASGLLTGMFNANTVFEAGDHRQFNRNGEAFDKGETFSGINYELGLKAVDELKDLFPKFKNLAPVALKWILNFPEVSCIIPGASRTEHVLSNLSVYNIPDFSLDKILSMNNIYNKIPMVKKMNPDLTQYVTQKAIDGLFIMIAREELKIRKDPMARTSELLKKVFGN